MIVYNYTKADHSIILPPPPPPPPHRQIFYHPMLRLGLVSEEEHCQLFGNLQTILSLHEGLGLANNVCTSFSVAKIVCMYMYI